MIAGLFEQRSGKSIAKSEKKTRTGEALILNISGK